MPSPDLLLGLNDQKHANRGFVAYRVSFLGYRVRRFCLVPARELAEARLAEADRQDGSQWARYCSNSIPFWDDFNAVCVAVWQTLDMSIFLFKIGHPLLKSPGSSSLFWTTAPVFFPSLRRVLTTYLFC